MRRRSLQRALVAGLAVLGAALAGKMLALELRARPDRVVRANFDRIKEGVRREQVYAVIGPPGDYRTGPTDLDFNHPASTVTMFGEPMDWWYTDTRVYSVQFDPSSGLVVSSGWDWNKRIPQTRMENLLWRAKRQWHRWFPE